MSDGGGEPAVAVTQTSREIRLPPYRFWETRAGRGTPVILIHGLGGSADWWRRNIDAIASEHVAVAIDLVGFGRNRFFLRRSSLPLAFADIAGLLGRWLEASFDERVHVVGNSMGGHVAIHLAAARPDLVRSLTLVDSTGIPFDVAPGQHLKNLIVPRGALSFATILARDALRSGPTAITLAFARLLRDDARPLIRQIRVPALLLWGERDPLVPLAYAKQMNELIPGSRLVVVPDAGHIPMWENPEFFNRELLEFLRGVESLPVSSPRSPQFSWTVRGVTNHVVHRESGHRRDVVLVHGLGMSSAYFAPLAQCLFDRGLHAIAPDLPGFGDSADAPARTPEEHARLLIDWAEALGIRDAVWVGHSVGGNVVAHIDPEPVCIGPLWTHSGHPIVRLLGALALDGFREPASLYAHVLPAYWRAGLWRWWMTFRRSLADFRNAPPPGAVLVAGEGDPLPDPSRLAAITRVPGAHACLYSNPAEVAEIIAATSSRRRSSAHPR